MSKQSVPFVRLSRRIGLILVAGIVLLGVGAISRAGHFGNRNAVGGILVDGAGVVRNVNVDARKDLRQIILKELKPVADDLKRPVELRSVSLKGLNAAIIDAQRNNLGELPDEVRYLAGLQRIQYVLAVPEQNDILLVGPAEGWKVDENANIVGVTTGLPVLHLEDLLITFRSLAQARQEGISCSIEPTDEGRRNLEQFLNKVKGQSFSPAVAEGMEQALGAQQIKLTGIPGDSHFARVLVASDYHMKRLAMNFDKAPVPGLPGFLDLLQTKRTKLTNMMPRWWLACNYEPLLRSEDGLTWELRGPGVKAMTEDDLIAADGSAKASGKKNPVAQQWADMMTAKYEELSLKNSVFADLRNLMDMAVIAALIDQEGLLEKVGCSIPQITDVREGQSTIKWPVPKSLATQCSFIKRANEYIVTASGGVQIDSFGVASRVEVSSELKSIREKTGVRGEKSWWWN